MDQVVNPSGTESTPAIETVLGLGKAGSKTRRRRGWLYGLMAVAVIAAAAIAVYAWQGSRAVTVDYTTVPAARADLTVQVSATGTLQPLTQVDISSELSGIIRTVAVDENQQVEKGDVLASLDTSRLEAQIERARASAKAADANVENARITLKENEQALARTAQLAQRGQATSQALEAATATRDRAKAALDSAEANLAIADADLKLQQSDLARSTIYAPIDGIVLTRSVDPGQTVASSLQAPVLFVIAADLKKMELKAAIDEADIGSVKIGQPARFTVDAFPERPFDAEIRDISFASVTTDGVVTYDARLEVANDELLLRPGMTATVSVITREARDVLTVPSAAFRYRPASVERDGGWSFTSLFTGPMRGPRNGFRQQQAATTPAQGTRTLYVLKDGQPQAANVRIGATNGELTEVLSGVSEGDPIITASQQRG